jgi:hypothetical protein
LFYNRSKVEELNKKNEELSQELSSDLPDGVIDFDRETGDDPFQVALYAKDIFKYYKKREAVFPVAKYLSSQSELNKGMRSILVDWLVEVQVSSLSYFDFKLCPIMLQAVIQLNYEDLGLGSE